MLRRISSGIVTLAVALFMQSGYCADYLPSNEANSSKLAKLDKEISKIDQQLAEKNLGTSARSDLEKQRDGLVKQRQTIKEASERTRRLEKLGIILHDDSKR